MSETTLRRGGTSVPSEILVTHDDTLVGDGSARDPMGVADVVGWIVYGGGNDGPAIFDGRSFPFATFASGVYSLTRDIFLADGSVVQPGITVFSAGRKTFCSGRLTNFGVYHCDGNAAVGSVAGAASALGTLGIGTAGGAGRSNNTGAAGVNQSNVLGDAALLGQCAGGNGGRGGVNAGGAGGTYTGGFTNGGANYFSPMLSGFTYSQTSGGNQAQLSIIGGGAGGGGGGSDSASATGGGGGGAAGVLALHALELWNFGIIRVGGGHGGDASGTSGNAGGGAGGGGGILLSLARRRHGSGIYLAPGGAGGLPFGSGGGVGGGGRDGHLNLYTF